MQLISIKNTKNEYIVWFLDPHFTVCWNLSPSKIYSGQPYLISYPELISAHNIIFCNTYTENTSIHLLVSFLFCSFSDLYKTIYKHSQWQFLFILLFFFSRVSLFFPLTLSVYQFSYKQPILVSCDNYAETINKEMRGWWFQDELSVTRIKTRKKCCTRIFERIKILIII